MTKKESGLNLAAGKNSAQISDDVPAKVRAHCFFSARVARVIKITGETDPTDAERQLKSGIQIVTPENQTVTMGQEVLDHWTMQDVSAPKPVKEIEKRLKLLDCAKKTLSDPQEIWEQETQRTFFKRFEVDGRTVNMMVTVTSDGKCRSYMTGGEKYTDKARKGLNRVYKK